MGSRRERSDFAADAARKLFQSLVGTRGLLNNGDASPVRLSGSASYGSA
jgi:hypothetical protein